MARDIDGREVLHSDDKAVCWCLLGALHKISASKTDLYDIFGAAADVAYKRDRSEFTYSPNVVVIVNDSYGYDAVMETIDLAIEKVTNGK